MPWPVAAIGRYLLELAWPAGVPGCARCHDLRVRPRIARGIWPPAGNGRADRIERRRNGEDGCWVSGPGSSREGACPDRCIRRAAERQQAPRSRYPGLRPRPPRVPRCADVGDRNRPEEARLRKIAGPGVTILGRVSEQEKRERLGGRAHALVVTSVREGWGLVVTEAAAAEQSRSATTWRACGTRSQCREVYSRRPIRAPLAAGLAEAAPGSRRGRRTQCGACRSPPGSEVAAGILAVAREAGLPIRRDQRSG